MAYVSFGGTNVEELRSGKTAATQSAAEAKALGDASAQQQYQDELGDIDVWAAEEAVSASKEASDKSYNALANLGSSRSVGGGTFNSLVAGRGSVNLGGLSGGLTAANTAKLSESKKKDAAGDLTAAQGYTAAEYGAKTSTAEAAYAAQREAALRTNGFSAEEIASGESGWSSGIGNYRFRINAAGSGR